MKASRINHIDNNAGVKTHVASISSAIARRIIAARAIGS